MASDAARAPKAKAMAIGGFHAVVLNGGKILASGFHFKHSMATLSGCSTAATATCIIGIQASNVGDR